ncbi:MAG: polyprenyl synthetase family protein [Glycocaulis sp.]
MNGLPAKDLTHALPDPVTTLMALGGEDMARVEGLLAERMASPVALIPELANWLINAGGKRIRPLITVSAARMLGYQGTGHLALAGAVELIHTATLLHDDVVDDSALRRGKTSANQVWGNPQSVLVGDFLFAQAFTLMVDARSLDALHVLSRAAAIIAEGEVRQLSMVRDIATSREAYMEVIDAKTAALFAAAARVSPILAGRPKAEEDALNTYGRELGLAFQLVDDALDYGGLAVMLGKNTGDDFREGKITLPVAIALERADARERAFWQRTFVDGQQGENDLNEAIALMQRHGALDETLETARGHAARARSALAAFPDNDWTEALSALAGFVVERAY